MNLIKRGFSLQGERIMQPYCWLKTSEGRQPVQLWFVWRIPWRVAETISPLSPALSPGISILAREQKWSSCFQQFTVLLSMKRKIHGDIVAQLGPHADVLKSFHCFKMSLMIVPLNECSTIWNLSRVLNSFRKENPCCVKQQHVIFIGNLKMSSQINIWFSKKPNVELAS